MDSCCYRNRPTRQPLRTIRVVHFDGYIEDYESPATVDQVLASFPKHFMTTPIRLIQIGMVPLKVDTLLETGKIYFLLPCSFMRFNESSRDLVFLAKKLTNIAKTRQRKPKPTPLAIPQDKELFMVSLPLPSTNVDMDQLAPLAIPQVKKPPRRSLTKTLSNIAKPPRVKAKPESASTQDKESSEISNDGSNGEPNKVRKPAKPFSWKPLLSTIREMSFNRRESDLRD